MADTPDVGVGNLDLQRQLNSLITERNKILAQHNSTIEAHNNLIAEMSLKLSNMQLATAGAARSNAEMNSALEESSRLARATSEDIDDLNKKLKETDKKSFNVTGILKKMGGALLSVGKVAGSIIGVLIDAGAAIFNIAKAVIAWPFALLGALIEQANSLPSGPNPIKVALEDIRKAFGDLNANEGKAVAGSLGEIRRELSDFAGTGLRVARIYGYGSEGIAAAMKDFQAIAEALGPSLNRLQQDVRGNIPELLALTKGFTTSAEATAAMLKHAKSLGKDGTQEIIRMTGMAQRMGKQYGINAKIIGKAVGEMSKDVSNFGSLSSKQLMSSAVYASKLGIEIKELADVMNKFLNFEDAAKGAAEMAQAFGMNVDVMELMKGGPEAIDEMRKAFFASGRSIENMSNAERKLLEMQTGLTGASLEAALAAENQGLSYDQIASSAEDAESVQEQQIKVMRELGKSIERVFGSGGDTFKDFTESITKGFNDGLNRAGPFLQVLQFIRTDLRKANWFGRELGKTFGTLFPGFVKFSNGLAAVFNPVNFKQLFHDFSGNFRQFMNDLSDPKKNAVKVFLENIKKTFSSFFSRSGPGGEKIFDGFKTMVSTVWRIFKELVTVGAEELTALIKDFLKGDFIKSLTSGVDSASSEVGKALGGLWDAIVKAWDTLWPVLQPKLEEFGTWLKEKFFAIINSLFGITKEDVESSAGSLMSAFSSAAPFLVGGMIAPIAAMLAPALGGVIKGAFTATTELITRFALTSLVPALGGLPGAAPPIPGAPMSGAAFGSFLAKGLAILVIGAVLIPLAASYLKKITPSLMEINPEVLPKLGIAMLALGGLFLAGAGMLGMIKLASYLDVKAGAMLAGIGIIAAAVGAMALTAKAVNWLLEDIDANKLKTQAEALDKLTWMGTKMSAAALVIGAIVVQTYGLGALVIGAGVAMIASVITGTVTALMPAIKALSKIKLENPEHFEKTTTIITKLADTGANTAMAIAAIMKAIPTGSYFSFADTRLGRLKEGMKLVTSLSDSLSDPIKKMQPIIADVRTMMTTTDPAAFEAGTKFLAALLPPILDFMMMGPKLFSSIQKSVTNSEGEINTIKFERLAIITGQIMSSVSKPEMLTSFSEAVKGITKLVNDKSFSEDVMKPGFDKKMTKVVKIFEVIKSFSSITADLIGIVTALPYLGNGKSDSEKITSTVTLLNSIIGSIPGMLSRLVTESANVFNSPELNQALKDYDPKKVEDKVEMIKSLFEILGGFTSTVAGISEEVIEKSNDATTRTGGLTLAPDKVVMGTKFGQTMEVISKIISDGKLRDFVGQMSTIFGNLFKEVGQDGLANVGKFQDFIRESISALKEFTNFPSGISSGIRDAYDAIVQGAPATSSGLMQGTWLQAIVQALSYTGNAETLKNAESNSDTWIKIANNTASFLKILSESAQFVDAVASTYIGAVTKIQEIGDAFATTKTFELAMDLRDLLQSNKKVVVDTTGAEYHISLVVNIDAEKLAENLAKTKIFGEKLGTGS